MTAFTPAQLVHALGAKLKNPYTTTSAGGLVKGPQDEWSKRLDAYQADIEKQSQAKAAEWDKQWETDYAAKQKDLDFWNEKFLYIQGQKAANQEKARSAKALNESQGLNLPQSYYDKTFGLEVTPDEQALAEKIWGLKTDVGAMANNRDKDRVAAVDAFAKPLKDKYGVALSTAEKLRAQARDQAKADADYKTASSMYDNAVTQHDKDYAAFKMYQAKKAMYDQDTANRQADIDAGRYAVNPYQFMAQGANLNEINALREQVNAGNLRPNMRVPDAEVAPTEVKDPGEFARDKPQHVRVAAPEVDDDIATILGYEKPGTQNVDPTLKTANTGPIDTSSVHSDYVSPADKAKPPEPEKDANGNPVIKPGSAAANPPPGPSNTLQQTATGSQAQPNQQTAQQAATPAPAMPAQPTGSTGGQTANTGQEQTNTPTAPTQPEKPKPFTEDVQKEDPDHVW